MKEFGRDRSAGVGHIAEPFQLHYLDENGDDQVFEGVLSPKLSIVDLKQITSLTAPVAVHLRGHEGDREVQAISAILNLLTKMMSNRDGVVKASWYPAPLPKPADLDEDEAAAWTPSYRGPDGQIYEFADTETAAKWEDESNWTTKRRWAAFMDPSFDADVDQEDLIKLVEWGVELVTDRPTSPQS